VKVFNIVWQLGCAMILFYTSYIKFNVVLSLEDELNKVILHCFFLFFLAIYFVFSSYGLIQSKAWGLKHSYLANLMYFAINYIMVLVAIILAWSDTELLLYVLNLQFSGIIIGLIALIFSFRFKRAYNKPFKQDK
jgi:hypothetical protein